MKSTRQSAAIGKAEALELLQSAVSYCQRAGLTVAGGNVPEGLGLTIAGAELRQTESGPRFVLAESTCPPLAMVQS